MNFLKYPAKISSAWKILLDCGINSLPVNPKQMARKIGIRVLSYGKAWSVLRAVHQEENARGADGLTLFLPNGPAIFYDDTLSIGRRRVTVGHELGHIILRHVSPGQATRRNRPPAPTDAPEEFAANLFCEQIVAPSVLLLKAGAITNSDIESLCGVTKLASDFILSRQRERGPGYRPTSPYEKAVSETFLL